MVFFGFSFGCLGFLPCSFIRTTAASDGVYVWSLTRRTPTEVECRKGKQASDTVIHFLQLQCLELTSHFFSLLWYQAIPGQGLKVKLSS